MGKLGQIRPYRLEGAVTIQIEFTSRHAPAPAAPPRPGAEVLDARTVRYTGNTFLEAWQRARF
jgi:D-aminopeptidase